MGASEITKEIILTLIETGNLSTDHFPDAKTYVDVVCCAYKQVFKTVRNPDD